MARFGFNSCKDERYDTKVDMSLLPWKEEKNKQIGITIKSELKGSEDYILVLRPDESKLLKILINGLEE